MNNLLNFYVYAYLRDRQSSSGNVGTPYYIGKGCYNRMFNKQDAVGNRCKSEKYIDWNYI